jgi:hypothetical protein
VKRNILFDSVPLVENAEHCDALRHRRDAPLPGGSGRCILRRFHGRVLLRSAVARGEREHHQQRRGERPHAYSGIHGS